ncbi:hypothetical protein ACJZ2D_000536 [Fusarium nematophilum]
MPDIQESYLIRPRPSISGHPLSENGRAWLASRLGTCCNTHPSCRVRSDSYKPSRLLRLTKESSGDIKVVLQEEFNNNDARILLRDHIFYGGRKYAALSHCWGDHQSCVTEKGNLEARKAGIPWSAIPKTFQDAIKICLELGVHFL